MTDHLTIPIGKQAAEIVNAVVEISQGETNKYKYDKMLHVFRLDRSLYSSVHYPDDNDEKPLPTQQATSALQISRTTPRCKRTSCRDRALPFYL